MADFGRLKMDGKVLNNKYFQSKKYLFISINGKAKMNKPFNDLMPKGSK